MSESAYLAQAVGGLWGCITISMVGTVWSEENSLLVQGTAPLAVLADATALSQGFAQCVCQCYSHALDLQRAQGARSPSCSCSMCHRAL